MRSLVERIDGLPLAIELAAARSEVVSPVELLARLDSSLSALGRDPVRTPRHADLRATVRWSWELLDPLERQVLAACCVFVGPFEPGAAVAVARGDEPEDLVLDALHALRRKGLLTSVAAGTGPRRLVPYASVRAFATEQADPASLLGVRDRHASWFAQWGTRATEDALASAAGESLLGRMVADLPEVFSAIDHAGVRDPASAVRLFLAAAQVLSVFGPVEDIERWARVVLPLGLEPARVQMARVTSAATAAVLVDVDRALEDWPDDGRALRVRAEIANLQGRAAAAQDLVDRASARLRTVGDEVGITDANGTRNALLARVGAWDAMGEGLRESLGLYRRRGHRAGEARVLHWLALVSSRLGSLDRALDEAVTALALTRDLLDPRPGIDASTTLSAIHRMRDEPAPAFRASLAALAEARRIGFRSAVHACQVHLALLASDYRSAAEAREWVAAVKQIERELGDPGDLLVDGWLGTAELADGRTREAIEVLSRATEAMAVSGSFPYAALFALNASVARRTEGDVAGARAEVDRAFGWIERMDPGRTLIHRARAERAVVKALSGDPSGAMEDLAFADTLAPHVTNLARTRADLCRGLVLLAGGDRELAQVVARRVRAEVDRRGLGPTTDVGARLARFERMLADG